VPGRLGYAVDAGEAERQGLALVGAGPEAVQDLAQGRAMHPEGQVAVLGQWWEGHDRARAPLNILVRLRPPARGYSAVVPPSITSSLPVT
jgi:hypothetical protein